MHHHLRWCVLRLTKNRAASVLVVLSLVTVACDGGANSAEPEHRRDAPVAHTSSIPSEQVLFDIPALIGRSIDQVRDALGTPQDRTPEPTQLQLDIGIHEWSNVFTSNGQDLLVTFDAPTRRVVDFFLAGTDRAALMRKGNLDQQSSAYRVEPVRALRDPSKITGVKVTPAP
jgi:hypothetical protein